MNKLMASMLTMQIKKPALLLKQATSYPCMNFAYNNNYTNNRSEGGSNTSSSGYNSGYKSGGGYNKSGGGYNNTSSYGGAVGQ